MATPWRDVGEPRAEGPLAIQEQSRANGTMRRWVLSKGETVMTFTDLMMYELDELLGAVLNQIEEEEVGLS